MILTPLLPIVVSARYHDRIGEPRDYYPVEERDEPFFLQSIDTERHDESAIAVGNPAEIIDLGRI